MCIICLEFNNQRLTVREAKRALGELKREATLGEERAHLSELEQADDETFKKIASKQAV